jgi:hypothetical protein
MGYMFYRLKLGTIMSTSDNGLVTFSTPKMSLARRAKKRCPGRTPSCLNLSNDNIPSANLPQKHNFTFTRHLYGADLGPCRQIWGWENIASGYFWRMYDYRDMTHTPQ